MQHYYSATTGGFYNSAIHGDRTIMQADPSWVRPTKTVVLKFGESIQVGDTVATNRNKDKQAIIIEDVPDMDAVAPLIEVANPNCQLPADAAQISAEQRIALIKENSAGQGISGDDTGQPVLTGLYQHTPEQLEEQARAKRDKLLKASDWVALRAIETGTEVPAEWAAYRQALRDITTDPNWPNMEWPKAPE